jgi:hypothetical protein
MSAQPLERRLKQQSRTLPRRMFMGGSLSTALLRAIESSETAATTMRAERCIPAGRRCGTKKTDRPCRACCHRHFITTSKGTKKCACKSDGTACGNNSQCCSGDCQGGVCVAGTQGALIEVGNGVVGPTPPGCEPTTATGCSQELSGVITGGMPISAGTFAGTTTVRNLMLTTDTATGDVSGPVTLTETATGAQLLVAISGRATTSLITGAFTFRGGYTITGELDDSRGSVVQAWPRSTGPPVWRPESPP